MPIAFSGAFLQVLPQDMVDNSISPSKRTSGGFCLHSIAQRGGKLHPRDLAVHLHSSSWGCFLTPFRLNM